MFPNVNTYYLNMEKSKEQLLTEFKKNFWDAFHRPKLESERFEQVWKELEPINDLLAGPLYSIYEKGNCEYIFQDNERFPEIKNPDDLFDWLHARITYYKEEVENEKPQNEKEEHDVKVLLYQADKKMELAEAAAKVLRIT